MTVITDDHTETTDVIICGCGPTGALLSALLGQKSVNNVVLEREREVVTDPRGIALDEEGIRLLQQIGVYDKVHSEIGETIGRIHFISGKQGLILNHSCKWTCRRQRVAQVTSAEFVISNRSWKSTYVTPLVGARLLC